MVHYCTLCIGNHSEYQLVPEHTLLHSEETQESCRSYPGQFQTTQTTEGIYNSVSSKEVKSNVPIDFRLVALRILLNC